MHQMKIVPKEYHSSYGIIYSSLESHDSLGKEIKKLGYSPVETSGEWEGSQRKCWSVPRIELDELVEIARKFGQEDIVYCPENGVPRLLHVCWVVRTGTN